MTRDASDARASLLDSTLAQLIAGVQGEEYSVTLVKHMLRNCRRQNGSRSQRVILIKAMVRAKRRRRMMKQKLAWYRERKRREEGRKGAKCAE